MGKSVGGSTHCALAMVTLHLRCLTTVEAANEETHPLETKWTFWFDNPEGKQHQAQWGKTLRPVYTFGTVEEFWG